MAVNVSDKKIKTIVKESVREVLRSEIMKLRALVLPEISEKEQKDIEKRYGAPSKKAVKSYTLKI
ncbi:MAG: hypothetical protein COS76_00535 [Candidatus Portnoybacteria bacterium CG06_land_8_20_14_3_00_39_12]|uniref:Trigger factor n=1 Tax=Candidatus Portnoybacteria bacterium CG06_land_8_20_14_3_00_39_12 TaxID=1974809 RepID=A0A2M7AY56_9BACT|nr:MAG: hypothetical protein COS76_00535 [Candidatus Portnoybacteria bacterium CG06_land_8_20_14_3_00_39_12]